MQGIADSRMPCMPYASLTGKYTHTRAAPLPGCSLPQRPCIPGGPYLERLRVLAMSDAKGFQDDVPLELLAEPLRGAPALEVLRLNRCLGLQLSIEGEGGRLRS